MSKDSNNNPWDDYSLKIARAGVETTGTGSLDHTIAFRPKQEGQVAPGYELESNAISAEIEAMQLQIEKLQSEKQKKIEQRIAIARIPILFDTPDFTTVENNLTLLSEAGVQEIHLEGAKYSLSTIQELVATARNYIVTIRADGQASIDENKVESFLAEAGVTRKKVSPHSGSGFRECMKACIMNSYKNNVRLQK